MLLKSPPEPKEKALKTPLSNVQEALKKESAKKPAAVSTSLKIKYNCGFGNCLTLRGSGLPGLNWNKGFPLKNCGHDEWTFETTELFSKCEYKVLLNDTLYEMGHNHQLVCGSQTSRTPHF